MKTCWPTRHPPGQVGPCLKATPIAVLFPPLSLDLTHIATGQPTTAGVTFDPAIENQPLCNRFDTPFQPFSTTRLLDSKINTGLPPFLMTSLPATGAEATAPEVVTSSLPAAVSHPAKLDVVDGISDGQV